MIDSVRFHADQLIVDTRVRRDASKISMVVRPLLTVSFSRRIRNIIARNVYVRANRKLSRAYVTSRVCQHHSLCNVSVQLDITTKRTNPRARQETKFPELTATSSFTLKDIFGAQLVSRDDFYRRLMHFDVSIVLTTNKVPLVLSCFLTAARY